MTALPLTFEIRDLSVLSRAVLPGWRVSVRGLSRRAAETQTPPLAIGMVDEGAKALSEEPHQGHVSLP
jgi:hypothetical protein